MLRTLAILPIFAALLGAHPMGNFSVSHYARIEVAPGGSRLVYALDLAEIPTFELFQQWGIEGRDAGEVQGKARAQAKEWMANVEVIRGGRRVLPSIRGVKSQVLEGAGGMAVLRVEIDSALDVAPGAIEYRDRNYEGRAGWKEIVIRAADGARLGEASHTARDLSAALTAYPADTTAPPQDLEASLSWTAAPVAARAPVVASAPPPVVEKAVPAATAAGTPSGTVVKGDYLSRLLRERALGWDLILLGLAAAFGLGAMHALSPGHGKTIVAAYLVGSRGTPAQALFLGGMVTFTHTISVFFLGLGVLFFQEYVAPERIIPVLGAVSGISIVCIGAWLLYKRTKALALADAHHQHSHSHVHSHGHPHSHGGSEHSHDIPDASEVSIGSLIALGASGGLVPCPSALVLMLSAIALGRTAFGLGLLVSFSLGLAVVLMAIGLAVIYAKHLLPEPDAAAQNPFFRLVPVLSAFVVMVLGMLMTLTSLGWIRNVPFAG